ncbi:oxygen-regulated protein 1 [Micropterus dolomieu]|uniref:oxygen-regulated protein 1 n=1 Tax=Micropterus dolomieu TaxID=147949 RepID=UPI001E8CADB2|nr:oxygen-regulated protein 1 [Micropterus dolomieu]
MISSEGVNRDGTQIHLRPVAAPPPHNMSNTPIQEPPAQELSSGSGQTSPSRPFQPISDPSASKRVCFYKSGDPKFSGHRMVISARTFKTFDALLDALSKKVPLPFGVRTITTPRGTHLVKALDDLLDGGSYVCSDQKRVKPLNLDEVNRRQVPWNTTRPVSAGRRKRQGLRFGRRNEVTNRPAKVTERVAVRTPKKLVVIKNRDPTVKRTIVLQRRTAPTFEALLDYLSQILQFPVLKLFSTDGRRVDSLTTLILCAGVVVAAGNEPFRLGNYSFHRTGQMAQLMYADNVEPSMVQPTAQNSKSFSSGRGSRNFSLSSERYIVDQINKSRNGTMNSHLHHNNGSFETEVNHRHNPMETCGTGRVDNDMHACIVPKDDDIEKSFRVNQDGSMTVEMKVRLTIKEEEMLHWTTTLSRSSLSKRTLCASISETGNSSPDSNNAIAKDSSSTSEDESKEENHPADTGKVVGFNDKRVYEGYTSTALATTTGFKRTPTPGPAPRHVRKKASVESVKMVTESGVKERTLGHYSYLERTADGETTEGYCVVRHSSSSSNKPIPKPRKTVSAGASNKGSHSSIRSPGVAEVLQIQNNGMEVTETVMHIYESQGCYDNYFANEEYSADGGAPESKPSTDSGPQSSSNDCDIDFSRQPPTTESRQRQKEEMLSLSSEPITSTHELINNRSSVTENEAQTATNSQEKVKKDKSLRSENKKKIIKPARNEKSSTSTSGSDKKQKESIVSPSKKSRHSSKDKLSSTSTVGKKDLSSSDSAKSGQKSRGAEKHEIKKTSKDENMARKEQALLVKTENVTPPNRQNINKAAAKDNGHNVNTPTGRPQMKKNMLDILQPKKALLPGKKTISKPKSMTESILSSPKRTLELGESFSMPSLNPSPSEIHQYVENWLEKVNPDPVPYTEEAITDESEPRPKVVFQIGGDSESDEKNECQTNLDEYYPTSGGGVKKSASCLSVPLCHAETGTALLHNEQYVRGLCVSMPSVRVDPVDQENRLRSHKSAEAIAPADNEPSPSMSNILSPTATIKPVLRQLCSSIQCIRGASDTNTTSNLEKSSSLPDFPTQVASVFGSSCKALVSFLSVMTLRDNLTGAALGEGNQSRSDSEAMLMMESLQKISAIEDEEEQRASLTDLQSRASSRFRERWKDFQILRERLESEPLSPKVSETEFALDVFSEGGETFEDQQFCIDELMEELNMPQDLRAEISSTIQQAKSFYPVEESTFVEAERNQSDSEEDVEKFVEEYNDEAKQSSEPDTPCIDEDITQTKQGDDNGEIDNVKKMQSVYSGQATQSELSGTERDEPLKDKEEEQVEEVEDDREDGDTKEVDDDDDDDYDEKTETGEREEKAEEKAVKEEKMDDKGQGVWEAGNGSGEEEESVENAGQGTEEVMTVDEEEEGVILEEGEKEAVEETEEGLMDEEDQEAREDNSFEETDERDGVDETEEEGRGEEGETEEKQRDEIKYEADEVIVETDEGGEVENIEGVEEEEEADASTEDAEEAEEGIEVIEENNEEEEMNEVFEEKDEVEIMIEEEKDEVESRIEEEKDEVESREEKDEVESLIEEEKDEVESLIEEEKDETGVVTQKDVEEVIEDEEEEDEEEMVDVIEEEDEEEDVEEKDKEEDKTEVVSEENQEEEEEREQKEEQEHEEDGEDVEVKSIERKVITVEEGDETDMNIVDEEKCGEVELEKTENSFEEESGEEKEVLEEAEDNAGQMQDEEEREDDEEENERNELNEGLDQVEKQESNDEAEEENVSDVDSVAGGTDCKSLLEEASYMQQLSSCEGEANVDIKVAEYNTESPTKYSSEGLCEDDKGNGTDTVNEIETDEVGELGEERSSSLPHAVEISQELLDFVNLALQSSSLIFTYDAKGNIRIEPDNARVVQTKQIAIPKSRADTSYGLKCLPSPSTSDLSDYRPETSESGGYKTQESVDIVTESGEEASGRPSPVCRSKTDIPNGRTNVERLSVASNSEILQNSRLKSGGSFSSYDSGTKASKEDLSYFSAASSQKADAEPATEVMQCISFPSEKDSTDGVLIDQGRWLLKENHLIRKSPPVSLGMYGSVDSTSIDTGQENSSVDSLPHHNTQYNPLAAISSSELEEMAKPQTPKCTYYSMPHGSDSDPFLGDSSVNSSKKDTSSVKGRGFRVSPKIDTSKSWENKNGSLSSFASVEFKIPDRKVHPEGESSAVTQARRTSSGERSVLQAQDSLDTLRVRCGQYCPIL